MQVRTATVEDAPAIARIHVDTWRSAYRGLMPDAIIESRSYQRRLDRWSETLRRADGDSEGVFVALADDGRIAGFASGGPARDADLGYAGELYTLYVLQ